MHEIMIAVGIGLWFVACGIFSYIFVSKAYKNVNKEEKKEK